MERFGGIFERIALAMAGKRNPWGKPGSDGGNGSGNGGGDDGGEGGDEGGTPEANGGGGNDGGEGPRNPWLPGGSKDGSPPRRSASIEDIFKNRGPEGPRRAGGGGGKGPNFRMPSGAAGKNWFAIGLAALAAIWLFMTSVHFVQPGEQAVVNWMGGKYSKTFNPGTNWSFPWPIQQVDVENVDAVRLETIPDENVDEKLILTSDQNLVDLSYLVRWNISDLTLYRYQLADPADTLREVAESAMRAAIAEQELDTVLTGAGRADIESSVRTSMQQILDALGSGIVVQGVDINKTDAPQQVIEAFNDVLAARQDAARDMNDARRFEQQLLATAQGGAAEFNEIYAQYRLAPQVTRQRLYYETMERVLSQTDKTIIETEGVTPYLPLPEIRRRSQQPALVVEAAAGGQ